jgi:hypothetical protein
MASSPVTVALLNSGSADVHHGFWYSYGTILPKGQMLTLSSSRFTLMDSALTLLIGWALSRLWRIFDVIMFCVIIKRTKHSLHESQCATLVVNTNAAAGAFFSTGRLLRRGGPRRTLAIIFCASLLLLAMSAVIPAVITRFPRYDLGLVIPKSCSIYTGEDDPRGQSYGQYPPRIRLADAALAWNDRNQTASVVPPLPTPVQSYIHDCPPAAAECNPDFPFTFSSSYTLHEHHFGLNIGTPFSLNVSDTCYQPIQDVRPLNDSGDTKYGYYYGNQTLYRVSNVISTNYTETAEVNQTLAAGYKLTQYTSRVNESVNEIKYFLLGDWMPNATLRLGGDTTILFYFVGGVIMQEPSSDPIFATNDTTYNPNNVLIGYTSLNLVSPIICDTKYMVCDGGGDCSSQVGVNDLLSWVQAKPGYLWKSLDTLFSTTLFFPPIYLASVGSSAVAASQGIDNYGLSQLNPNGTTTDRELSRLVYAGMTILASSFQLASLAYWGTSNDLAPSTNDTLCSSVIIESAAIVTAPVAPYVIALCLVTLVVFISHAELLGAGHIARWRRYSEAWILHTAGQLHRALAEVMGGSIGDVDATVGWPQLEAGHRGFDVVGEDGSRRLGLGVLLRSRRPEWHFSAYCLC